MTTVTISLPDTLANQVDQQIIQAGFATRSEFVRSLIRRYFTGEISLEPFQPQSLSTIKQKLAKTGKYNQKFIDSVTRGLAKSSAYAN